jgi:hypothetical protein
MMLGTHPRNLLHQLGRSFTFKRGVLEVPVKAFLRGLRAGELVNSETQADASMTVDAVPLAAAGVPYLLKFDRLISAIGESYSVQESHVAFDGETAVFHECKVRGGGAS